MAEEQKQKVCFAVTPIGEEESEVRRRSDQVLRHIIQPVVTKLGYEIVRADQIPQPGMITNQVIDHLLDDDLVVADLTDANANVFYELALRHATRKPVVSLMEVHQRIPFDVNQSRTIMVDHHDLDSVARCKEDLERQVQALIDDPENFFTPVSVAVDMKSLRESGNPAALIEAQMFTGIQSLRFEIDNLQMTVSNLRNQLEMQQISGGMITAPHIAPQPLGQGGTLHRHNTRLTSYPSVGDVTQAEREGAGS